MIDLTDEEILSYVGKVYKTRINQIAFVTEHQGEEIYMGKILDRDRYKYHYFGRPEFTYVEDGHIVREEWQIIQ